MFALPQAPRYNKYMLARIAIASVLLASLSSCGASANSSRARTGLDNYLVALRGNDPRPIYEMLSKEQRGAISYQEWSERWQKSKAERELQAQQIEDSLRVEQSVNEDARLRFDDGRTITLARAPDGWRLNQALVGRTQADSPEDALAIFSTALRERNVDNLLRILSKRHRANLETQLQSFYLGLEEELAKEDSSSYLLGDNRAELAWNYEGIRYKVVLVRHEGEWHIDDIHLGPDPTLNPEGSDEQAEDKPRPLDLIRGRRR